MKKNLIFMSVLFSLQISALPNEALYNLLQKIINILQNDNASLLVSNGGAAASSSQNQAAASSRLNTPVAPPSPVAGASDNINHKKLEEYLRYRRKIAASALKNNNCPKSGYIDTTCLSLFMEQIQFDSLVKKVRQGRISSQEIASIQSDMTKKVRALELVINESHEYCLQLKESSYVDGEYITGHWETRQQKQQLLDELARLRQMYKDIFGELI